MKDNNAKRYIYWGLTAVCVIAVCIVFWYCIREWKNVSGFLGRLRSIASPIIYGAILAYLISPVYNRVSRAGLKILPAKMKSEKHRQTIAKSMGTIASLFVILAVVSGLIQLIIPQVLDSLKGIQESFPIYLQNLYAWIQKLLADNREIETIVIQNIQTAVEMTEGWLQNAFTRFDMMRLLDFLTGVSSSIFVLINFVKNWLIGLIVMVYLLNIKDHLITQAKKIVYGCLSVRWANHVIEEMRFVHRMFGGFIIGKILDSLIIGVICFVGTSLLHIPYALLVSVIVGVTNVIPFFGPFIGAVPSAFLILLVDPMKCLYFLIFILVLQQFDGNILGPKILGDSTGLPSFWVLFSILLFGGLFGFVGMIIAVPTFAVIYRAMSLYINSALKKKNYSENTPDYCRLHHIDPRSGDFIDMDQWPEAGNKGMNDLDMAAGEELEEKTENIEK